MLRSVISVVTTQKSYVYVISKNFARTVNAQFVTSNKFHSLHRAQSTLNYSTAKSINTMPFQVFLTRSDFPTTGIDLLQNEYG